MNPVIKKFQYGRHSVTIETGRVARQASGSVMVSMEDVTVLVAVVGSKSSDEERSFFPLTVNYQEKFYAVGKIPGGFLKREGRPSEKETLTSRLIDRPIRPLFPNGFMNEVQVTCTVVSANDSIDPDIPAMIGTSAALAISGIPFNGPIGAARVGFDEAQGYILNPTYEELKTSKLDMVVAGTQAAVLMVESEADELTEDQMLGAVLYAHQEMQAVIQVVSELAAEVGKPVWDWQSPAVNSDLMGQLSDQFGAEVKDAYKIKEKATRYARVAELKADAVARLGAEGSGFDSKQVSEYFSKLEKQIVRESILAGEPRIDGRDNRTVRAIDSQVGVLARTHGSALFTRGETQAIGVTTLGTTRDAKIVDALNGSYKDPFMLHYNFPPYSVGECGRNVGPGRREIGHGRLARRGIAAVLPNPEEFPYTIRVVSEITESNGSSSMASVCVGSMSLMDAGVPIKAPVAGIAMGLIKEGDRFAVLTDILGDEDHLGDMDFKVAGTSEGVTALQMDIKIEGITEQIMEIALQQAQDARLHILGEMSRAIAKPRSTLSENAPAMTTIKIDSDKIRDVIGKGGATIRSITEETGAEIDIDDDGTVRIYAPDKAALDAALFQVNAITAEAEVGKVYRGTVARIVDFGAFVTILPGKDGLVHISQISQDRVEKVSDVLTEGQEVDVIVLDVDARGRIKLSMKEVPAGASEEPATAEASEPVPAPSE